VQVLASLLEFMRDLAVLAAGIGIANWAWTQHVRTPQRDNADARAALDAERHSADLRQWAERMEAGTDGLSQRLDEIAAQARRIDQRSVLEVRIHGLLQSTSDPFLTFAEIRDGLARTEPSKEAREPDDAIRRALIALIAHRAVAQLDRDRYFIASDFEADDSDGIEPK
jgi:hypothetical protein